MEKLKYPGNLHGHTEYSNLRLRDCIIKINKAISYAEDIGYSVIGFTDHESISSWVKIEKESKSHPNLKVIRGNEIYLCRNGLNASNYNKDVDKYFHFILLAKDLIGARQIMEISTRAWLRSYITRGMRRVPTYYNDLFEIIGKDPGHIIGSTACLGGALPTQILKARNNNDLYPKIEKWIVSMNQLFGQNNFYFELQPSNNKDQIYVNKKLIEYSKQFNIPYIITTDSHYIKKEDRLIHKAYLNAQNGEREVDDFYATTYMMSNEELESYFKYLTEDELQYAYQNIINIQNNIENFSLLKPLKIPSLKWKQFDHNIMELNFFKKNIPMLETFEKSEFKADNELVWAIIDGINNHNDLRNKEAYDEINACLKDTWESSCVNKAQWSAYYLNLQKIIDICWDAGSLVGAGRGSGVGFILLYVLGITQINPLRESTKTFRWRLTQRV